MASYHPMLDSLRRVRAIWRIEDVPADHIDEAYYLGGEFDDSPIIGGWGATRFYYMVWRDVDQGRWYAGHNPYGPAEVPFSKTRCATIGGYPTRREALIACEVHAANRLRSLSPALAMTA